MLPVIVVIGDQLQTEHTVPFYIHCGAGSGAGLETLIAVEHRISLPYALYVGGEQTHGKFISSSPWIARLIKQETYLRQATSSIDQRAFSLCPFGVVTVSRWGYLSVGNSALLYHL